MRLAADHPEPQSNVLDPQRLARLEAILTGVPGDRELRLVLELLDPGNAGTFTWLDQRNASLVLMPGIAALPVQVLLELKGRGELGVLVISREGMGRGAPLSRGVLEQLLERLQQLLPESGLRYRSDRDGPLEPIVNAIGFRQVGPDA
ncbi:hypothetical protein [Vulcanococcus sp.]|uniref:hypothetical protein n=1 Tax=Vulcanococcus sp. TaxID=2856995 RepID=UPI003F6A06EF